MDDRHELEMAQERGAALLDNSTVTGANTAIEQPERATAADAQALADLLEALVLHESVVIDHWGDSEQYPDPLLNAACFATFDPVGVTPGSSIAATSFTTSLVLATLDQLERGLRTGELARQYARLQGQLGAGEDFSPLFARDRELHHEIVSLYRLEALELPSEIIAEDGFGRLRALESAIDTALAGASRGFRRYAMFMLHAFYYDALAAAFSLAYVPHTFRAQALLALPRPQPLSAAFTTHVRGRAGAVRRELGMDVGLGTTVDVPAIASRLARDVDRRRDLIPAALALRDNAPTQAFRTWVRDQERNLHGQTDLRATVLALRELEEVVASLRAEYPGRRSDAGHPVTIKASAGIPELFGVEASTDLHLPAAGKPGGWLRRVLGRKRPHLSFFSELARDQVAGGVGPFARRLTELPP